MWQQLVIRVNHANAEELENACIQAGAMAVTFSNAGDQMVLEPAPGETPLWPATELSALFDRDTNMHEAVTTVSRLVGSTEPLRHRIVALEDRDWEREWLKDFRPARFGNRLWVCPHGQPSDEPGAVELHLDPGLAFGTGTHATTAMCLEWLDRETDARRNMLDYGCGSGILAIAGLLLGARYATATDIDPQALTATRANALANKVADRLLIAPVGAVPETDYDLLVANILASTLMDLAEYLAKLTARGGAIGLSGVLVDQADEVRSVYSQWFDLDSPRYRDEWAFLSGTRR